MRKSFKLKTHIVREMRRAIMLSLALLLALAAPAVMRAHDYWIEPDRFIFADADINSPVLFYLHMGDHFTSEQERPLQLARTTDFRVFAADRATDLALGAVARSHTFLQLHTTACRDASARDGTRPCAPRDARRRIRGLHANVKAAHIRNDVRRF